MGTLEAKIASVFGLTEDKREQHANPRSVWTRFASMPFIILAFWSRVWIWWYCLIPIIILIIWIVINPTLFKKPDSFDNRWSKAVLWERYWSQRKARPVPVHHTTPVLILTMLQTIWGICLIYGLRTLHIWATIVGAVLVYMAKMRFLDRMVWIYEDMQTKT